MNEAFWAWADMDYNRVVHSETGQTPRDRWQASSKHVVYVDENKLHQVFKWREHRTPDKSGVFSLFNIKFQVGPAWAKRRVEIRYEPENLAEIEVWHQDHFIERLKPFEVNRHRRPKGELSKTVTTQEEERDAVAPGETVPTSSVNPPKVDWLRHLVQKHQGECFYVPDPPALRRQRSEDRQTLDAQVIELLRGALSPETFDADTAQSYLD